MAPLTVLIVDDHQHFRTAARRLLEAEGFDVVGEAADGREALATNARLQPEVVVLDIGLPGLDGFAVAERLAAAPQPPRVVLVSTHDAETYGRRVPSSPARGFLVKEELTGAALARLVG